MFQEQINFNSNTANLPHCLTLICLVFLSDFWINLYNYVQLSLYNNHKLNYQWFAIIQTGCMCIIIINISSGVPEDRHLEGGRYSYIRVRPNQFLSAPHPNYRSYRHLCIWSYCIHKRLRGFARIWSFAIQILNFSCMSRDYLTDIT